jgi:hypothetical protein
MSEKHVTADELQHLERRDLESAELLKVMRHLARCSDCARMADGLIPNRLTLGEEIGNEPDHLDAETQLFPWVDGTIDSSSREIVETHLEDCAICRAEAEDLRRLRRAIAPPQRFARRWALAAVAALAVIAGVIVVNKRPPPQPTPTAPRTVPRVSTPVTPDTYTNPEWSTLVAEAVRARRLPIPSELETLRPAADPLRGGETNDPVPLSPAGIVVATARPRFQWPAANRNSTYAVTVFDGSREVAASEVLATTEWTPPSDLPAGRTLAWQVDVTGGGKRFIIPAPPAPPALFRIATAADRAQIDAARSQHPNDHFLHAVLYARAGLVAEAEAALQHATEAGDRRASSIARTQ